MCNIKYFRWYLVGLLVGCVQFQCAPKNAPADCAVGSDLASNGEISRCERGYRFTLPPRIKLVNDACNYIYFEGDMLCFSFAVLHQLDASQVAVWFVLGEGRQRLKAERLEISASRVYGFSLVGSLLESYFSDCLEKPLYFLGDHIRIPCSVVFEVVDDSGLSQKKVHSEFSVTFVAAN